MRRAVTFVAITLLLILSFIPPLPSAHAHQQIGPFDISGDINGAPYRIMVPANWIALSFGPSRLEPLSASRVWNSLVAFTMAHSARVVKAQEPLAFGIKACPAFFPT